MKIKKTRETENFSKKIRARLGEINRAVASGRKPADNSMRTIGDSRQVLIDPRNELVKIVGLLLLRDRRPGPIVIAVCFATVGHHDDNWPSCRDPLNIAIDAPRCLSIGAATAMQQVQHRIALLWVVANWQRDANSVTSVSAAI